jgi:hypothetical protein
MSLLDRTDRSLVWLEAVLLLGLLVLSVVTSRSQRRAWLDASPSDDEKVHTPSPVNSLSMSGGLLLLLLAASLISSAGSFYALCAARPHGNWDAWAMWNMKARFFYLGHENWRLAVCDEVSGVRPDYPFFLPLTVARFWADGASEGTIASRMIAALYTGLVVLILIAGVARVRGIATAALACLVLLGANFFVLEGASQYADIEFSAFMLSAIVLLTMATHARHGANRLWALTGLLAGCAAWTKNEGLILCLAVCAAIITTCVVRKRIQHALVRCGMFLLGAAPFLLCVLSTKLAFAWRNDVFEDQTFSGAAQSLTDPARYRLFWQWLIELFPQYIDTRLFVLLAAFGLLARVSTRRSAHSGETPPGPDLSTATLTLVFVSGCYAFIYLITPHDLGWHMRTSLSRLVLHLWPSVLLVLFCAMPSLDEFPPRLSPQGPSDRSGPASRPWFKEIH